VAHETPKTDHFFFLVTDIVVLGTILCGVYWNNYSLQCWWIVYNYPPNGRSIVVDIYWDAKRRGIYPPLFTDPEGNSCFSIYQIRWIKKRFFNFFFRNFHETTRHFSLCLQNSKYPRIFLKVTGANQNTRKLLSTDLVNTNGEYLTRCFATRKRSTTIHLPLSV